MNIHPTAKERPSAGRRVSRRWTPLLAGVVFASLIGCSSLPGIPEQQGGNLTIMYNWSGFATKLFQDEVLQPFIESHPGFTVSYQFNKTMSTQYPPSEENIAMLQSPEAPEVLIVDRLVAGSLVDQGLLADLTSYVKAENLNASAYYAPAWDECMYNGQLYCLPWEANAQLMFYNKTILAEAGFNPEQPPTTLQQLDDMAQTITKYNDKGNYGVVGFLPWQFVEGGWFTDSLLFRGSWQQGTSLTPGSEGNVKALEWIDQYNRSFDAKKLDRFIRGYPSFTDGAVAFAFGSVHILQQLLQSPPGFEWGVAAMPTADGGAPATWSGGYAVAIAKNARYSQAAWPLLKYLGSQDGAMRMARAVNQSGGIFISAIPAINEELQLTGDPQLAPFIEAMTYASARPEALLKNWAGMEEVVQRLLEKQGDPQQLLDEWQRESSL